MPDFFKYLIKCILLTTSCICTVVMAGSIGFSVSYNKKQIELVHQGTDAAYNVSLWSLNQQLQWQKLDFVHGNPFYIAPMERIRAIRNFELPDHAIGVANPLLLQMQDQAGSQVIQLAWEVTPLMTTHPLSVVRSGNIVKVTSLENTQRLKRSFAVLAAYTRISNLAKPLIKLEAPADPFVQDWSAQPLASIDTGEGQAGVWWIHETNNGALELQIVNDGIPRGQEQIPDWLKFFRMYMFHIAQIIGAAALICMVYSLVSLYREKGKD